MKEKNDKKDETAITILSFSLNPFHYFIPLLFLFYIPLFLIYAYFTALPLLSSFNHQEVIALIINSGSIKTQG